MLVSGQIFGPNHPRGRRGSFKTCERGARRANLREEVGRAAGAQDDDTVHALPGLVSGIIADPVPVAASGRDMRARH
jgi:hypothetical protein